MARTVLLELLLFLLPFAAYAFVLYATKRSAHALEHWPVRVVLSLAIVGAVLVIAGFFWLAHFGGAPPGGVYEPAHIEDGKLVPGRIR